MNSHNIVKSGYAPEDPMPVNRITKNECSSKGYECKLRHYVAQHIVFNDSPGTGRDPKQQTAIQFLYPEPNWETFKTRVNKMITSWESRAEKIKKMAMEEEALKTANTELDKKNKELEDKIRRIKKEIEDNKNEKDKNRNDIQTLKNKLKTERQTIV